MIIICIAGNNSGIKYYVYQLIYIGHKDNMNIPIHAYNIEINSYEKQTCK